MRVLVPNAPGVERERRDEGVEIRAFRYAPRPFELVGYGRSLESDERVRWASKLAAPLYLAGATRALRRELGGASARWDLLHAHWIVPNGVVAAPFASQLPVVAGLHGSDVFLAEKPGVRALVARALARTAALTSCSPELARRIEALGFDAAKSRVIPYGVDVERFRPDPRRRQIWRDRLGIPSSAPLVLAVGRMATKKGFQRLIERLPELLLASPESHWVFAGAGDRWNEYRVATERFRDRVHLPGTVLHDTLPDLYRAADLFVLPAVHDGSGNVDGLPNVILEAMASALPVVASAISGIPLAVVDGETGHLVGEEDHQALVTRIVELLASPAQRSAFGTAGRLRAERELTWTHVAARYRAAYLFALARGGWAVSQHLS